MIKRNSSKFSSDFCQCTHLSVRHMRPNIQKTGSAAAAACWSFILRSFFILKTCYGKECLLLPQSVWLLLSRSRKWHPYSVGVVYIQQYMLSRLILRRLWFSSSLTSEIKSLPASKQPNRFLNIEEELKKRFCYCSHKRAK